MTQDKALYAWFNNFMTAYVNTAVPETVDFPFMTYEYVSGGWGDENVAIAVNMWFNTDSEAVPNTKAADLRKYIETNDMIECDEGYIWVMTGEPWCQSLQDEEQPSIKRRYINITLNYITR